MSWCSVTSTFSGGRSKGCRRSTPVTGRPVNGRRQPAQQPGSCLTWRSGVGHLPQRPALRSVLPARLTAGLLPAATSVSAPDPPARLSSAAGRSCGSSSPPAPPTPRSAPVALANSTRNCSATACPAANSARRLTTNAASTS
jgi:hypothetical protein